MMIYMNGLRINTIHLVNSGTTDAMCNITTLNHVASRQNTSVTIIIALECDWQYKKTQFDSVREMK